MVYYICHCVSMHVCLDAIFILAIFGGKKLSFWLSACSFYCGAVTLN